MELDLLIEFSSQGQFLVSNLLYLSKAPPFYFVDQLQNFLTKLDISILSNDVSDVLLHVLARVSLLVASDWSEVVEGCGGVAGLGRKVVCLGHASGCQTGVLQETADLPFLLSHACDVPGSPNILIFTEIDDLPDFVLEFPLALVVGRVAGCVCTSVLTVLIPIGWEIVD